MPVEASERAPERKKLQAVLKAGIDTMIQHLPDDSIGQFEDPNFPRRWDIAEDEGLILALQNTIPKVVEFAHLAEAISSHNASDLCRVLYAGFEHILAGYDLRPGFSGGFNDTDFDLYKFIGHELMVTLVMLLIREEHWETLTDLLEQDLVVKTGRGTMVKRFHALSETVTLLKARGDHIRPPRVSVHADMLKERHESGELGAIAPFDKFMEADYLLLLRAELEPHDERWGLGWWPWSAAYLEHADPPRYLLEATRRGPAKRLASVLGLADEAELRERLRAVKPRLAHIFGQHRPSGKVLWRGSMLTPSELDRSA